MDETAELDELAGPVRGAEPAGSGGPADLDRRLLAAVHVYGADPRVAAVARALSWTGEHGALWLAAGLTAAALDRPHRTAWLRATALTATAHLACVGVKRVVRRPRPGHVQPLVRTAGRHSFPSAHATSAVAAAVAYGGLGAAGGVGGVGGVGVRAVVPLAAAMCVSRVVAGVHYPSDVVAGAALGAVTAGLGAGWVRAAVAAGTVVAPGAAVPPAGPLGVPLGVPLGGRAHA